TRSLSVYRLASGNFLCAPFPQQVSGGARKQIFLGELWSKTSPSEFCGRDLDRGTNCLIIRLKRPISEAQLVADEGKWEVSGGAVTLFRDDKGGFAF
ncbi:MAG: hypothetical protein ACI8XO_004499, partial [Verrucomicrobiales bacterium]